MEQEQECPLLFIEGYTLAVHVIPMNDNYLHAASGRCPCRPHHESTDPETGTEIYRHNAFDCRELYERHFKDGKEEKPWTVISEYRTPWGELPRPSSN